MNENEGKALANLDVAAGLLADVLGIRWQYERAYRWTRINANGNTDQATFIKYRRENPIAGVRLWVIGKAEQSHFSREYR